MKTSLKAHLILQSQPKQDQGCILTFSSYELENNSSRLKWQTLKSECESDIAE